MRTLLTECHARELYGAEKEYLQEYDEVVKGFEPRNATMRVLKESLEKNLEAKGAVEDKTFWEVHRLIAIADKLAWERDENEKHFRMRLM